MCVIYECPVCEDRDCDMNVCGLCHDLSTIISCIPSGMYSCDSAVIDFTRKDYVMFEKD